VEKTALIITDGADSTRKTAESIAGALRPMETAIIPADQFDVTKLLAAAAFFLGAESPEPSSFSSLCNVLAHINLPGRPCGVFSSSKAAADYLCGILRDSEAAVCAELFLGEGDIKAWTEKVIKGA
jgi:hypothetical protein